MNNPGSQVIVERFFRALYLLKEAKKIRGKKTFSHKYNINHWNLLTLEKDLSSNMFQPVWLYYLVRDYNVSAEWLITGNGEVFKSE